MKLAIVRKFNDQDLSQTTSQLCGLVKKHGNKTRGIVSRFWVLVYLLVRLVEPVRVEEEPRLESRLRWPVGEVTDEVVVVVAEEVVEEFKSSCLLPKEPLEDRVADTAESNMLTADDLNGSVI